MQLGQAHFAPRANGEKAAAVPKAFVSGPPAPQTNTVHGQRSAKLAKASFARKQGESFQLRALGYAERSPVGAEGTSQPLNIAFVSAEVAPWSKTGGLGDVVGGLPIELARRGHNVITIAPRYDQHWDAWDTSVTVDIDGEEVRYFHTVKDGVDRVWVDHPWFLAKVWGKTGSKLYGSKSGSDYEDNQKRFLLFNKAALKALEVLPFSPGTNSLVVANDWHTAILPVLVKEVYQRNGQYPNIKTALCIHNIAFQGRFWRKDWGALSLPDRVRYLFDFTDGYPRVFSESESDASDVSAPGSKYEKLNWLKAGILTADKLLTVSPNYATEIAEDDEKGVELADVIRKAGGLEGIVNGCDVNEWSPFLDKYLDVKYDAQTLNEGKAVAKETLQAELGLPVNANVPLFGFIGRLEEQKGVDILIDALPNVAREGNAQVVILGTGKKALEAQVLQLDKTFPNTVKGVVKFNVPLAHLITAGADFMLVPSRFEPCGLIQLHAMNYGTVPVVSSTGGLVDTVKDGVTGFHAGRFNPDRLDKKDSEALANAVRRAAGSFHTQAFKTMRERCIVQDLSWETPAKKWEAVLQELLTAPHKPTTQPPAPQQKQSQAQRNATYPTPVQEVNKEGDAVPYNAVARKTATSQSVISQNRPPPANGYRPSSAAAAKSSRPPTSNGPASKLSGTSSTGPSGPSAATNGTTYKNGSAGNGRASSGRTSYNSSSGTNGTSRRETAGAGGSARRGASNN